MNVPYVLAAVAFAAAAGWACLGALQNRDHRRHVQEFAR